MAVEMPMKDRRSKTCRLVMKNKCVAVEVKEKRRSEMIATYTSG